MSSFIKKFRNKKTGEIVEVFAIDDYFGSHEYGYKLPNGTVYREEQFYNMYEEVSSDD